MASGSVSHAAGKFIAILLVLAGLAALAYFWHPLAALAGLFLIPSTQKQREEILARPAADVVASQPADVRSGVAAAESGAVSAGLALAESLGKPAVTVTVSDPS